MLGSCVRSSILLPLLFCVLPETSILNEATMFEQISPRYQIDLHLEVTTGTKKTTARSHDISLEGIGAYIPADLEVGQYIDILMKVPFKPEDLTFGAIVRNRKGYRYGLAQARPLRCKLSRSHFSCQDSI